MGNLEQITEKLSVAEKRELAREVITTYLRDPCFDKSGVRYKNKRYGPNFLVALFRDRGEDIANAVAEALTSPSESQKALDKIYEIINGEQETQMDRLFDIYVLYDNPKMIKWPIKRISGGQFF